jgi:hypothetical protein
MMRTKILLTLVFSVYAFLYELNAQQWSALGDSLDGSVYYLYDDTVSGQLIATGGFDNIGSLQVDGIAAWDGEVWSALATGIYTIYNPVGAICRFQDDIYSEGVINIGSQSVLKLNNGIWEEVGLTHGVTARLRAIGDKLYALGTFDSIAGIEAFKIAAYDGSQWASVGNDLNAVYLNDVAEFQGELYVVGKFDDGQGVANIAKLVDGEWLSVGGGINTWDGYGGELLIFQNKLYVSGYFQQWEGNAASNIMAWDGNEWFSPQGGVTRANGQGFARRMTTDGDYLYVAGGFDTAGILPTSELARWDGQNWCGFNVWTNNATNFLMHYQNRLVIAGSFFWVNDSIIPRIAATEYYIDLCSTVGIGEVIDVHPLMNVFPNPTSDRITIKADRPIESITITDLLGRELLQQKGNSGSNSLTLDVSTLVPSVYLVGVATEKGYITKRLVVE